MRNLNKNKKSANSGMTLVEIIVSLTIFVLIMMAIWGWQKDIFSITSIFNQRLTTQENLRKTIKSFITEMRTAQASETGAHHIERADKDEIIFFSDFDYDKTVERLRYFLEDEKIKKGVIEPSGQPPTYNPNNEVITKMVDTVINENDEFFFYYDQDYDGDSNPLTQPVNILDIRLIKIIITVNENPDRPLNTITETSQTSIRNLKDNL